MKTVFSSPPPTGLNKLTLALISGCMEDYWRNIAVTLIDSITLTRHRAPRTKPALCPFFITFLLYRPHRHPIAIVQEFTDSTASKTAPVSRDGPKIRRKTIFGGSLTTC